MQTLKFIALAIVLGGMANFAAFFIHSMRLGGSAWNGHVTDGHYFVGEHGRQTEVSKAAFESLLTHEKTVMVSFPIAIIAGIIFGALQSEDSKRGTT